MDNVLGAVLAGALSFAAIGCVASDGDEAFSERNAAGAASGPTAAQVEGARLRMEQKRARYEAHGLKPFNKPDEAQRFFVEQRLEAGMRKLSAQRLRDALDVLEAREQAVSQQPSLIGTPAPGGVMGWIELGPGNIGGRTRALVIDPTNPAVMYAGGVTGGVWKTIDGGASWDVADDLMLNLAVTSLALDPGNSSVLYAGTGEGVFQSGVQGLGVFKSTDAGASWNQLAGTVSVTPSNAFYFVNKVVVSPNDSNRVYAATRTGVWRSLNAGATWSVVLANPDYTSAAFNSNGSLTGCTDLVVRADRNPDVLFAAFGNFESDGLFRSDDGGDTWLTYLVPSNQGRMTLAFAPSNNDILYLLMADNGTVNPTGQLVQVFRSADGGNSFTAQVDFGSLTGPWLLSNLILATGCLTSFPVYSQGWYDNIIAVDPLDPDIVWVAGVDIFRSDDGARNFEIPGYWIYSNVAPYGIHADHHEIVFHPGYDGAGNQTLFVTNDGGIWRTQNARAATSLEDCPLPGDQPLPEIVWENLNNGYGVTQFYHGDSAKDRDTFIGGAQDNGTNRVVAGNTPNAWERIFGGDGGYVAIDPRDSQVVYIQTHEFPSIRKSTDGGETFSFAIAGITDTDGVFITPFAMDQSSPDVLWTGGRRPWRTADGALSWQVVGPDFAGPDRISAIASAPSNGNVVYLGFTNGYVVRSTNALAPSPTWTVLVNGLFGAWVSSLAVDPFDVDVAYCTYSSYGVPHVLQTLNGGSSWSSIDGIGFAGVPDIPAHWIEVRPCNPQQLYVGTELGVFVSDDRGASWVPGNQGLAHTIVESLDFKNDDTLVAFTHGRGAFATSLVPCQGDDARSLLRKQP